MKKNILITGVAGFIGFSLCKELLKDKQNLITGIDNLNDYYSLDLKKSRLNFLKKFNNFQFLRVDISNKNRLEKVFSRKKYYGVFNFAAQAGVRYSYENPESYCSSNIIGFDNILNLVKKYKVKKLIFASSSSVYGDVKPFPKKENSILYPLNIYSLSKLANEDQARAYSKIMDTQIIGLRFFSIYGEWGRPDMLILKYLKAAKLKKPFELFNYGNHYRDFTYIKDAISLVINLYKLKNKSKYEIFNICSSKPLKITKILNVINSYKIKTKILKKPLHSADVYKTYGDNAKIFNKIKRFNFTNYKIGVKNTIDWYLKHSSLF